MEDTGSCTREDGLNLTNAWIENHSNSSYVFATTNEELDQVTDDTEYLLGNFQYLRYIFFYNFALQEYFQPDICLTS